MLTQRYKILRPINSGRYGMVHLIKDTQTQHLRAMKILPKDRHDVTPFLNKVIIKNEMENLQLVNGRNNCVKLYDIIETNSEYNLIQEFCGGPTLTEVISRSFDKTMFAYGLDEGIKHPSILAIDNIINAIRHCHTNNIVYGDLKTDNIMLSIPDSQFKLIDFGSSIKVHNESKEGILYTTTPNIAPPEILKSSYKHRPVVSFKYDVWSIGLIACKIFVTDHQIQTPRLSPLFETFIKHCLKEKESERLSSDQMKEFWYDILHAQ